MTLRILVAEDDLAVATVLMALLKQAKMQVVHVTNGRAAVDKLKGSEFDLLLSDIRMPELDGMELLSRARVADSELPIILLTGHGSIELAVEAMRRGASDFLTKPFDRDALLFAIDKAVRAKTTDSTGETPSTSATSVAMKETQELIRKAARSNVAVLLRGETGTGKDVAARAIHQASARAKHAFVKVHCGALPDQLLESELFGYEKGAFTGAQTRKPGRVELAAGGTLFLDEIGEVTPAVQVKLLRLLQDHEYERLGGTETLKADVRVITATHRPLEQMIQTGSFREDLFYRLNVFPIRVPSLRERGEDLAALVDDLATELASQTQSHVVLSPSAKARLCAEAWPGNVRQLRNTIERLLVMSDADTIDASDVERELGRDRTFAAQPSPASSASSASSSANDFQAQTDEAQRDAIRGALDRARNNRSLAARLLGISRRNLYYKMDALGLSEE